MTKTFAVGIPTLNRFDLLQPYLLQYSKTMPNVKFFIIDNGLQGIKKYVIDNNLSYFFVLESESNYGVAKSWNLLCDLIFENHTHALILNDDIYLEKPEKELSALINKKPEPLLLSIMGWCSFCIPKTLFNKVGRFNEEFYPAYYEDDDYTYRMKLKGLYPVKANELIPTVYRNSETINKSPQIIEYSIKNKAKYIEIWGGLPKNEKFIKPYNK